MDDEHLKEGVNIGSDYFDEVLECIRDIRSSEKRFIRKYGIFIGGLLPLKDLYRMNIARASLIPGRELLDKHQKFLGLMINLFYNQISVDFWVWVNPNNWLVRHQITVTGGFTSGGLIGLGKSNLMFVPNPDFQGDISAFHHGITRVYGAEYNLEKCREISFSFYPSRLNAIYLFNSEEDANKYKDRNQDRILKKRRSVPNFPSV